ncbi:hypothetical protein [Stenotrophomonas sp.]|uniref:hypothetical protein n=1 Tax=Stenotrophomonas sp. TaxID=69392 RepID=UPI0028ADAB26|nr:hypothetical protein [Stenotrophomonas sp.]
MKRILPLVLSVTLVTAFNAPFTETNSSTAPTPTADTGAQNNGDATAAIANNQLIAYRWLLDDAVDNHDQRIDALFAHEDCPIILVFKNGELSTPNTCNRMGAMLCV